MPRTVVVGLELGYLDAARAAAGVHCVEWFFIEYGRTT